MSTLKVNTIDSQSGGDITVNQNLVFVSGKGFTSEVNEIGVPGGQGFGVGICPETPTGFSELTGTQDITSANYGNYIYADGSIMVWVPRFYYKIESDNSVDIKGEKDFTSTAEANAAGYALHRAFVDGGEEKRGFMVDKYGCSKAVWGAGYIASSIKNGLPLSSHADHNPVADLTACTGNYSYEFVDAAHARDGDDGAVNANSLFFCCTRFVYSALALLSLAHGQASSSTIFCAWYHATYNYPKGNNVNGTYKDTDDSDVEYVSDGYTGGGATSGKCGSGTPFARTTHNGQGSGVADLNGNMWEVSLGLTRAGANATDSTAGGGAASDFYVLKESVAAKDLTSGFDSDNHAWGQAAHLATLYDSITLPVTHASSYLLFGNGANQVLSEAVSGSGYNLTGLGIYKDTDGKSAGGTNLFGKDGVYEYFVANLCVISGGSWHNAAAAGVWAATLGDCRSNAPTSDGFRSACYPV